MIKYLVSVAIVLNFTACGGGDVKEKKVEVVASTPAPKIEIVENKNAMKIKVEKTKNVDTSANYQKKYYYDYNIKSEYSQDAQPANKDASVRVKPRTSIEANMNIRSPYEKIKISLLVRKLSKNFISKCSACHDDYANGVIGPSLLSKTADEIFQNIADFKSGKKVNVLMTDLINMMSEKEIKEIAEEIYAFNQKIKELRK
jgi:cytochrome c553